MDRNCLSYWFPKLRDAGVPVPRTEIVRTAADLSPVVDGQLPDGWGGFLAELTVAIARLTDNASPTPPVFLRTGQGSGKHDWKHTCGLDLSKDTLPNHVAALVRWSHEVDFLGLPTNVWVVRELLPVEPVATLPRYGGMPLVREYRTFVRGGRVVCIHPYWPVGAIRDGLGDVPGTTPDDRQIAALFAFNRLYPTGPEQAAAELAERVAAAFADGGAWSVDLLATKRGWFVTDMAEAARSFHWDGCPEAAGLA